MKSSTYIGLNKEYNKEDPKFFFGKSYIPNCIL